jgi:hypothetical protein
MVVFLSDMEDIPENREIQPYLFEPPVQVQCTVCGKLGGSKRWRRTRSPFEYDLVRIFLQISILKVFVINSIRNIDVKILQLNPHVYYMQFIFKPSRK